MNLEKDADTVSEDGIEYKVMQMTVFLSTVMVVVDIVFNVVVSTDVLNILIQEHNEQNLSRS